MLNLACLKLVHSYTELPATFGVYFFLASNGSVLYIGKSNNLRSRVYSHLSAKEGSSFRIAQQFDSIGYVTRAGEFDALLYEAYAVKLLQPIFNRKLRKTKKLHTAHAGTDKNGYLHFSKLEVRPSEIPGKSLNDVVAIAKSNSALQEIIINRTEKYNLCWRLAGLEKGVGPCFGYHLGSCKGACVGKESVQSYNTRCSQAFSDTTLSIWTFSTPQIIEERNIKTGQSARHAFQNWCHTMWEEKKTTDPLLLRKIFLQQKWEFDLDIYAIVRQYMRETQQSQLSVLT